MSIKKIKRVVIRTWVLCLSVAVMIAATLPHPTVAADRPAAKGTVTLCHRPGTPAEKTLVLPSSAARGHMGHGDVAGACGLPPPPPTTCGPRTPPPAPPDTGLPDENEQGFYSESVAVLEGASESTFLATGTAVTFRLSCSTLQKTADAVIVYDNDYPLPFSALALTDNSITLPAGLSSGRHQLNLTALDIYGAVLHKEVVLWVGNHSIPVLVLDEVGTPVSGASVVIKLADDPKVTATLVSDLNGRGTFTNLPDRSYNIIARTADNRLVTRPASVFDGTVVLRLKGFKPLSSIDNNDFSQGLAGWEVGTAPVAIIPHVEGSTVSTSKASAQSTEIRRRPRTAESSAQLKSESNIAATAATPDFDLRLTTSGEGQQSISRTFAVEDGIKSVVVRFRFITTEIPGGYFGTKFNDFFNVSIRTLNAGGSVTQGNSMNALGLAAFDASGATTWYEAELPIAKGGDTVQANISVANVADGLFDSMVIMDGIKKNKIRISELQLHDIDGSSLQFLSASGHPYFGGHTRVHGTLAIAGPFNESLEELKVEVLEGGTIATGILSANLAGTLYTTFGNGL